MANTRKPNSSTKKTTTTSAANAKPNPAKKSRERQIEVRVDPALAQAWKKLIAELESSSREGMRAWDRKYEAVGKILAHDPPLYLAGGVSTAGDFFKKYLPGEVARSVLRNVRVAQYASPDEETRYGTSKLDAAIDYLEAKHGKPTTGRIPVDFEKLRIATAKSAIAFPTATVEQVRAAARLAARRSTRAKPTKQSPLVVALTKGLPKAAKAVTVHYAGGYLHLGRIPVKYFAEVLRALAAVKLPEGR